MGLMRWLFKVSKRGLICVCLIYALLMTFDFEGRVLRMNRGEPVYVRQLITRPGLVIYNRMPFSLSLAMVFQSLNLVDRRFDQYSSANYNQDWLDVKQEQDVVEKLMDIVNTVTAPVLYDRHVRFIDFTAYNEEQPVYINLVLHPVELVFSQYLMGKEGQDIGNVTKSFEMCVETRGGECKDPVHMTMNYFCGSSQECLAQDEGSLELAKKNIERHYLLVGTEYEVKEYLSALEKLLPSFFEGISYEIEYQESRDTSLLKRKVLPELTNLTHQFIIDRQPLEYAVYRFIKQRFHRISNALKQDALTHVTHSKKFDDQWFDTKKNKTAEKSMLEKYGYLDHGCMDCIRSMSGL